MALAATATALPAATRFLDARRAADLLGGLNTRTLLRWAREGYVPAYPIGEGKRRLWRFLESDLQAWMLSRRSGASGTAPACLTAGVTNAGHGGTLAQAIGASVREKPV